MNHNGITITRKNGSCHFQVTELDPNSHLYQIRPNLSIGCIVKTLFTNVAGVLVTHEIHNWDNKRLSLFIDATKLTDIGFVTLDQHKNMLLEARNKKRKIDNMSVEQATHRRETQRIDNMSVKQATHRRETKRIDNMSVEQATHRRETQRIDNMSVEQASHRRKRQLLENLAAEQTTKKRKSNVVTMRLQRDSKLEANRNFS